MTRPHHFVVEGPRRDYDYTLFCSECHTDAIECAQEWLAEVFDALEFGENASVTVRVVDGAMQDDDECSGEACSAGSAP